MKKFILIFLIVPLLIFGQTKPRNPISPSGSWATNLVRAYAFSRADSVAVDSVKDWSSGNFWGTSTALAAAWINEGNESPGYAMSLSNTERVVNCQKLNTSGITDHFTVVQRVKLTATGTVNASIGFHNRLVSPSNVFSMYQDGYNNADGLWAVNTGTPGLAPMGTLPAQDSFITLIGTYAGDSVRVWINGTRTGADNLTGNIDVSTTYTLTIGQNNDGINDTYWAGTILMTCLWGRVITQTEINQITADPYVMFRAPTGKRGQVILIGSIQSAKIFASLFTIALAIGWINRKASNKKLTQR